MLVRMRVSMAGPKVLRPAGEECEVPDNEALSLFAAGYAEPVRSVEPERAVALPVEKAVAVPTKAVKKTARKVPKK